MTDYPSEIHCPFCHITRKVQIVDKGGAEIEKHYISDTQISVTNTRFLHITYTCPGSGAKVSEWKSINPEIKR